MAFNLGDKFEIHSLQLDVREIQKQLDVLFGGIPAQFVKPSPSWKYPTLRASDLNVTDVIQCNQFEEGSPEASKNLHFLLLELCVDRLLAAVQVSAGVVEKILDENTRLGTIFDVSNKLSIGPIAKAFGKLVEIAISASYERKADLLRKRRDFACAADSEEMKTRNPCKSCQELGNDLQMFIEVLTRCFPSHIPLASNKNVDEIPNSDELTENFISEVCGFCNSIDELRKLTTVKFTEAVKLQTRIIAEREISEAMKPHIVLLEKQVFENEATCKTLLHLKGDQELQLHQLNMDGSFLEQERLQYETQNGELEKELRERIAELESSTTEYFDLTAEREKRERQKNEVRLQRASESAALQSALKQAEVALQKCEGFDPNWKSVHSSIVDQTNQIRKEWQTLQVTISDQSEEINRKTQQLDQLQEQKRLTTQHQNYETLQQSEKRETDFESCSLKIEKPVAESHPKLKLCNIEATVESAVDCHSHGPDLICADHCDVTEEPTVGEILPLFSSDYRSLFAEFLEMPDVQGMSEWDLVLNEPDFGISKIDFAEHEKTLEPPSASATGSLTLGLRGTSVMHQKSETALKSSPSKAFLLPKATFSSTNITGAREINGHARRSSGKSVTVEAGWVVAKSSKTSK